MCLCLYAAWQQQYDNGLYSFSLGESWFLLLIFHFRDNSFNKCRSRIEDWQLNKFMECCVGPKGANNSRKMTFDVFHRLGNNLCITFRWKKTNHVWSIHIIYYIFITDFVHFFRPVFLCVCVLLLVHMVCRKHAVSFWVNFKEFVLGPCFNSVQFDKSYLMTISCCCCCCFSSAYSWIEHFCHHETHDGVYPTQISDMKLNVSADLFCIDLDCEMRRNYYRNNWNSP